MAKTGQPPMVAVCDRRYVFNPLAVNSDLDPSGPCTPDINVTTDAATILAAQSASAIAAQPDQPAMVYQAADPLFQKIKEILREH